MAPMEAIHKLKLKNYNKSEVKEKSIPIKRNTMDYDRG